MPPPGVVAEDEEIGAVGVVAGGDVELAVVEGEGGVKGEDMHELFILVVGGEVGVEFFRARFGLQQLGGEEEFDGEAAVDGADDRREERGVGEAGDLLHFGEVLVVEAEGVVARGFEFVRGVGVFVLGDHFFAAAGVAGEGEAGEEGIGGEDAGRDEGVDGKEEGGGVAAGVGDACGVVDLLPVCGGEFREAVGPRWVGAEGGAGVDDFGVRIVDHRDGFFGGDVGEAEKGDVGGVEEALALGGVFALVGVDLENVDVGAGGEVFVDPQAGGAFLAVDVNLRFHRAWFSHKKATAFRLERRCGKVRDLRSD